VSTATIEAGRRTVTVRRADKCLFPSGVAKRDLARYYADVAAAMLPHIQGRPLNLQQFPDGVEHQGFFVQRAPRHFPAWVRRVRVPSRDGEVEHVVASDAATLVYLADQAAVTPHMWLSRADRLDRPDRLVFDLDPPDAGGFGDARAAALRLGELLRALGLEPFAMLTGSRGVHVWVPLQRRHDFDSVRDFAREIAARLADDDDRLTLEQRKAKRAGRVLVDVMRNTYGHTSVAPYAVRAKPHAPVATPLSWEELERAKRLRPDGFGIDDVRRRLGRRGDPWSSMARHARALGAARRRLTADGAA
jgi:bifunctional non-homologous end joining protein LigD